MFGKHKIIFNALKPNFLTAKVLQLPKINTIWLLQWKMQTTGNACALKIKIALKLQFEQTKNASFIYFCILKLLGITFCKNKSASKFTCKICVSPELIYLASAVVTKMELASV